MTRPRTTPCLICSSMRPATSSSCQRVFIKIRLAFGFSRAREIVNVPIPSLLPHGFAVGILAIAEKVVAQAKIGAEARNADAGTNAVILTAACQRPPIGRLAVCRELDPKNIGFKRNVVANTPPPPLGKLNRMRRRQRCCSLETAPSNARGIEPKAKCSWPSPEGRTATTLRRRCARNASICSANQLVVGGGLKALVAAPFHQVAADRAALQRLFGSRRPFHCSGLFSVLRRCRNRARHRRVVRGDDRHAIRHRSSDPSACLARLG